MINLPPRFAGSTIVAIALVLSACSTGAYDVHAYTALSIRDGANGMKAAIREHHQDTLRAAVAAVEREDGEADDAFDARRLAALEAADEEWRTAHVDWMDGQRTAARTSTAYSNAAYRGLMGEMDDLSALITVGLEALGALVALGDILRRNGFDDLPELPDGAAAFLGGN
jgi:hypothetical protein